MLSLAKIQRCDLSMRDLIGERFSLWPGFQLIPTLPLSIFDPIHIWMLRYSCLLIDKILKSGHVTNSAVKRNDNQSHLEMF